MKYAEVTLKAKLPIPNEVVSIPDYVASLWENDHYTVLAGLNAENNWLLLNAEPYQSSPEDLSLEATHVAKMLRTD